MALRISRRKLSQYFADRLAEGVAIKKVIQELAAYLIDSKRTDEVELIIRDTEYALSQRGIVVADIVSARELSVETRNEIAALTKKTFKASHIELRDHIDPTVIGGVRIDFAGLQLDNTIKQKLTALRANHKA
jgi:F-type H+-transporting ATPase subunit delta